MNFFDELRAKVGNLGRNQRILFPESTDHRVLMAAVKGSLQGLFQPVLMLSAEQQKKAEGFLQTSGMSLKGVDVLPPATPGFSDFQKAADLFADLRAGKVDRVEATRQVQTSEVLFASLLHRMGEVDGVVAGAVHTSGETISAYIRALGPKPGINTVSSFFLMVRPKEEGDPDEVLLYSDCGLIPSPNLEQLTDIGFASADSMTALTGRAPKVAYLSFSSKGSADTPQTEIVRQAAINLAKRRPDVAVDGELQFDAAYVPEIAESKAPESPLAGQANVLVFPSLDAGNIAYKITQRLAGFRALGPLIQGLDGAANDLSRGCSEDDILDVALITCLQSAMRRS